MTILRPIWRKQNKLARCIFHRKYLHSNCNVGAYMYFIFTLLKVLPYIDQTKLKKFLGTVLFLVFWKMYKKE